MYLQLTLDEDFLGSLQLFNLSEECGIVRLSLVVHPSIVDGTLQGFLTVFLRSVVQESLSLGDFLCEEVAVVLHGEVHSLYLREGECLDDGGVGVVTVQMDGVLALVQPDQNLTTTVCIIPATTSRARNNGACVAVHRDGEVTILHRSIGELYQISTHRGSRYLIVSPICIVEAKTRVSEVTCLPAASTCYEVAGGQDIGYVCRLEFNIRLGLREQELVDAGSIAVIRLFCTLCILPHAAEHDNVLTFLQVNLEVDGTIADTPVAGFRRDSDSLTDVVVGLDGDKAVVHRTVQSLYVIGTSLAFGYINIISNAVVVGSRTVEAQFHSVIKFCVLRGILRGVGAIGNQTNFSLYDSSAVLTDFSGSAFCILSGLDRFEVLSCSLQFSLCGRPALSVTFGIVDGSLCLFDSCLQVFLAVLVLSSVEGSLRSRNLIQQAGEFGALQGLILIILSLHLRCREAGESDSGTSLDKDFVVTLCQLQENLAGSRRVAGIADLNGQIRLRVGLDGEFVVTTLVNEVNHIDTVRGHVHRIGGRCASLDCADLDGLRSEASLHVRVCACLLEFDVVNWRSCISAACLRYQSGEVTVVSTHRDSVLALLQVGLELELTLQVPTATSPRCGIQALCDVVIGLEIEVAVVAVLRSMHNRHVVSTCLTFGDSDLPGTSDLAEASVIPYNLGNRGVVHAYLAVVCSETKILRSSKRSGKLAILSLNSSGEGRYKCELTIGSDGGTNDVSAGGQISTVNNTAGSNV